jgi:hypothetical protein
LEAAVTRGPGEETPMTMTTFVILCVLALIWIGVSAPRRI